MKEVADLVTSYLPDNQVKMVNFISFMGNLKRLDTPLMSSEIQCPRCGSFDKGMTCINDPKVSAEIMWFCSNQDCIIFNINNIQTNVKPEVTKRAIEWVDFCLLSDIGDLNYKIRFEDIDQKDDLIIKMRNFAQKPTSIALFIGDKGAGKTYACLAILELYTRFSKSCLFFTADSLQDLYLNQIKTENFFSLKAKLKEVSLLAIDDFAQKEPPPGFMSFVFDLINYRMQWSNKGTIITSNSDPETMSKYCGEALMDRLSTAILKSKFTAKTSRRRKI